MSAAVSPLFLERYELKYVIPISLVEPICRFIEPYVEMDYYSQISPDKYYTINSLYLDTPTLYFLRQKDMGLTNRFSMRIRSYGDGSKPPYFFETKYKVREFVKKKRGKVKFTNWNELFGDREAVEELLATVEPDSRANVEHFLNLTLTYNTSPVILTQYRRLAFLSTIDDYARVTFDRDLRYAEENRLIIDANDRVLSHYDHPDAFLDSGTNVILELKAERKVPQWIIDVIQKFNLTQGSFSKFGNSMETMYMNRFGMEKSDLHPAEHFAPLSAFWRP
ncbi:MAG: polyphosphate polymerase domain-containing protein [Bdellovibrionota bacterium]